MNPALSNVRCGEVGSVVISSFRRSPQLLVGLIVRKRYPFDRIEQEKPQSLVEDIKIDDIAESGIVSISIEYFHRAVFVVR